MWRLLYSAILIFLIFNPGAQAQQSPWQSLNNSSFRIYYQDRDSRNAVQLQKILKENFFSINYEIKAELETPIQVYIAPTESGFQRMTQSALPHWSEAVALPSHQQIIVKSPRWHRSSQQLQTILNHELVHVLSGIATGHNRLPRWFSEGLAIYVSGDWRYIEGKELPHAVTSGKIIKLSDIDAVLSFQQLQAALAYQESFAAVKYIVDTYSHKTLPKLLENIAATEDFQRGFHKSFGFTTAQFERELFDFLEEKYKYSFFLDFENWLWGGMLVLFFLAVAIRKFHNRKKIKQWQEDHQEWSPEDEYENW